MDVRKQEEEFVAKWEARYLQNYKEASLEYMQRSKKNTRMVPIYSGGNRVLGKGPCEPLPCYEPQKTRLRKIDERLKALNDSDQPPAAKKRSYKALIFKRDTVNFLATAPPAVAGFTLEDAHTLRVKKGAKTKADVNKAREELKLEVQEPTKKKKKAEQIDLLKTRVSTPTGKTKPKVAQTEDQIPLIAEPRRRAQEARQTKIKTEKKSAFNPEVHSLYEFVMKSGGLSIKKEGALKGELRGYFSMKAGLNLINNKTGLSVDDMTEIVSEAGFFPGETRVSPNEFLDALREDVDAKKAGNLNRRIRHPQYDYTEDIDAAAEDFYGGEGDYGGRWGIL